MEILGFIILFSQSSGAHQHHRGAGLCLIDFRQAVDTRQFPSDQMFVGAPLYATAHVVEGQPWKWQLDYHGLAFCIMSLVVSNTSPSLTLIKDSSGFNTFSKNPCK